MATKTITVKAFELQGELNRPQGVPFRWLSGLVDDMRKRVPDDEEETCLVTGAEGLVFTYKHKLTPIEELQEQLQSYEAKAAEIKAMLPREGSPLSLEQTNYIRKLLG